LQLSQSWLYLSLAVARLVEDKTQVSPQMREALAHDLGALLCLGEDECALQNGLDEIANAFGAPRRIRRVELLRGLDERKLSTRDAEKLTGVSHSEFSRIRNTQLRRFTLDRMIGILGKLDEDVDVTVTFTPRRHGAHATPHVRHVGDDGDELIYGSDLVSSAFSSFFRSRSNLSMSFGVASATSLRPAVVGLSEILFKSL
jgi:predicted XRE-type DNA-binding protein